MKAVVLGVGNVILSDEGLGVRCVEELQRRYDWPAGVQCIDAGCSALELLPELEHLDLLLIVDAVTTGKPAGSVVRIDGADLPAVFRTRLSPHQEGVLDLLATLRLLGRSPRRIVALGIEPASLALSLELSPVVAEALPRLCEAVAEELAANGIALRKREPAPAR